LSKISYDQDKEHESPYTTPIPHHKYPQKSLMKSQKLTNFPTNFNDHLNFPQQILKKFGFKALLPFQEQALECLTSKTNCLISRPSGTGRSTIYQICALLLEGIIIVVTQKQSSLKKRLEKINTLVSWGAINSDLSPEQQNQVFSLAKQKRLKLLFITPELFRFNAIALLSPELLVFEDPQEFHLDDYNNDFTKLVLCPILNMKILNKLKEAFKVNKMIPENNDLLNIENPVQKEIMSLISNGRSSFFLNVTPHKENIKFNNCFNFNNVKWVKEEEKAKFLVRYLKNNKNGIFLIFCNNKRNCESLCLLLNKIGLKASLSTQNISRNDQIFIVNTGEFIETQMKTLINFVIHYDFPLNFEDYIEDIANYSETCQYVGILSDRDYFTQRNQQLSSLLDKETIEKFLRNYIYESNKENFVKVSVKKSNQFMNLALNQETSRIITLNFNEISNEFELKPEVFIRIMRFLEEKNYLKSLKKKALKVGVVFRRKLEEIIGESHILKGIYYHSVNKNGKMKFVMREVENETKSSNEEILLELEK